MSIIVEILADVAKALVPQPETNEPPHVYRWRQTAAVMIMATGLTNAGFIAASIGWLAFVGVPGFASAGDLKTQQMLLTEIRASQIEHSIKDAKTENCQAQADSNMPVLRRSSDDLTKALNDYFNATGHVYPRVPDCSELIAVTRAANR